MNLIDDKTFKASFKGKEVGLFTLKNKNGMVVQVTNFGAKIVSIWVPDRNGDFTDICQGYNTIDEWMKGMSYYGATCGRVANRIKDGQFSIDGVSYQLPINNAPNSLHGGPEGFSNQPFDASKVTIENGKQSIELSYISADGEEGYPGKLTFKVVFTLTDDNELALDYYAVTDKTTHVNIASHSFFNLAGEQSDSILEHELMINASKYTPYDATNIPTGEIADVENTPMDFRNPHVIGERIDDNFEQLKFGQGYDHNWVLDKEEDELGLAAVYTDPTSGRSMEIYSTQPGIQVYTANWHDGTDQGKSMLYPKRSAICLETQHFPDAANKPNFPSTLLKPGEEYQHTVVHRFKTV